MMVSINHLCGVDVMTKKPTYTSDSIFADKNMRNKIILLSVISIVSGVFTGFVLFF
jgi:hypothetical protein